jgi:hypothetical protein
VTETYVDTHTHAAATADGVETTTTTYLRTYIDTDVLVTMETIEEFEDVIGNWIIETDTTGTGSTVERSNEQAYVGSYSAKCFTTNASAKAQVRVDYYDASTATWYEDCITDNRDMTNQALVNWMDGKHNSVSITTETTKYSVRSITYGTLDTF